MRPWRAVPLALPLAVGAFALAAPVPRAHGSDEVAFLALDSRPLAGGEQVVQPVPAQAPDLSGVELPYRAAGAGDAELEVSFQRPDGSPLGARRLSVRAPGWWETISGTASQYGPDVQTALIPVPAAGARGATMVVRRAGGTASLSLFFSRAAGQRLPDLAGEPGHSLALRTEYGGRLPALLRAPDVAGRLERWAPPWLPPAAVALCLAVFVLGGLVLVSLE